MNLSLSLSLSLFKCIRILEAEIVFLLSDAYYHTQSGDVVGDKFRTWKVVTSYTKQLHCGPWSAVPQLHCGPWSAVPQLHCGPWSLELTRVTCWFSFQILWIHIIWWLSRHLFITEAVCMYCFCLVVINNGYNICYTLPTNETSTSHEAFLMHLCILQVYFRYTVTSVEKSIRLTSCRWIVS